MREEEAAVQRPYTRDPPRPLQSISCEKREHIDYQHEVKAKRFLNLFSDTADERLDVERARYPAGLFHWLCLPVINKEIEWRIEAHTFDLWD